MGTKTVYTVREPARLHKLGFPIPCFGTTFIQVIPNAHQVFDSTVVKWSADYRLDAIETPAAELSFDNPDPAMIADICTKNAVDALLLTRLTLAERTYQIGYGRLRSIDTKAEMKLFDANGRLLVSVTHDTYKGNSYLLIPSPEKTLRDGTQGALKRIAQEINLTRKG